MYIVFTGGSGVVGVGMGWWMSKGLYMFYMLSPMDILDHFTPGKPTATGQSQQQPVA